MKIPIFGNYKASGSLRKILEELGQDWLTSQIASRFHDSCNVVCSCEKIDDIKFRITVLETFFRRDILHLENKTHFQTDLKIKTAWSHLTNVVSSKFKDAILNAKKERKQELAKLRSHKKS